ncbi:hypothetical protein [Azospirillum sp. TSO35-2]|uniref:hypothetical protein n=1 Tax=Azospirillum sp. TSO35-2 TaxID=716796 RepID=UPI000D645C6C|nr:hypothetical protein [Azospirillum sp. TSO35-2]
MDNLLSETKSTVWHSGERTLQEQVGVADQMELVGQRVIRGILLDQHRDFFAQLPFVVLGSVDREGDASATLLTGRPGFLSAPTPDALHMDVRNEPGDPASQGMMPGAAVGQLGIELHTRRRNRVNGRLRASAAGGFELEVDQSFGNCPQYIQLRRYGFVREPGGNPAGAAMVSGLLDDGTCRTTLPAGAVTYLKEPEATVAEGEVLICGAVPAAPDGDGDGQLRLAL